MNGNKYQQLAARTMMGRQGEHAYFSTEEIFIMVEAMGLNGEAGELGEMVKKAIAHMHGIDQYRNKIRKELGDCMWYIAALATRFGWQLEDIMEENIDKLRERYPDGFSSADSMKRVDVGNEPSSRNTKWDDDDEEDLPF